MALDDAENPQTTTALKSALYGNTLDPQTGIYTVRLNYYAAAAQVLAQIQSWSYAYNPGYSLDTAHAVMLPFESRCLTHPAHTPAREKGLGERVALLSI